VKPGRDPDDVGDDSKTATPVTEYDRRAALVGAEPSKFPGVSMSAQAVLTFNRNRVVLTARRSLPVFPDKRHSQPQPR
jgi:hypothetical protein